jgi:hypothetical protein
LIPRFLKKFARLGLFTRPESRTRFDGGTYGNSPQRFTVVSESGLLLHTTLYGKPHARGSGMRGNGLASGPYRTTAATPHSAILKESKETPVATATLSGAKLKKVLAALEENWQAEMEGYHTYLALAERDTDPVRAQVLRHLASAEWEHAASGHGRILELGGPEPVYKGKPRRRGRLAGQPRRRRPHGPAPPGDRREPPHRHLRRAAQGPGRRGLHRHPRARH